MSDSKLQPKRAILGEDGELHDLIDDAAETSPAPIYCIRCGTANRADGRFCRTCGQSLDEQAVNPASLDDYAPPEWKTKRSERSVTQTAQLTPQDRALMIEVFTLLVMGVLAAVSIATGQTWLALVILFVWFVAQMTRRVRGSQ
jgi:type IV secretory pathway TrbD component